jgi:outer membrane cobalamin receptor
MAIAIAGPGARAADVVELPPLEVGAPPPATDVTVLDPARIEAAPSLDLAALLRQLPGVHVDRLAAGGAVSSLYLRGADPNFTAIYVDGVKLNDPTNTRGGSVDFSSFAIEDIERIELLSGPASALLGADALAGAINIVTRRGGEGRAARATLARGGAGQAHGSASLGGHAGALGYALRAGNRDAGTTVEGAASRVRSFGANLDAGELAQLSLHHAEHELAAFPDDSGGPRHAQRRELDERRGDATGAGLRARLHDGGGWGLAFAGSWLERRELAVSPGVAPGERDPVGIPASRTDSTLRRADARLSLDARFAGLGVATGVQAGHERGASDGELELVVPLPADFALARDYTAAFVDADYLWRSGLLAEASLRRDDHGDAAPVTRRARLSYPWRDLTLSAGYAEGYKLPSFYALGNPTVGNPALRPEASRSTEAALLYAPRADASLRLALFQAEYRNAIDFEEGPPPRLVNRDRVLCEGFELGFTLAPAPGLDWQLGVTRAVAQLPGSTEPLRNRPRWTGSSQARLRLPAGWGAMLSATHVGANWDSSIPTGARRLPAYTRLDAALQWQARPQLALRAALDNALDAGYEELIGFPGPRRTARLELRLDL